MSSDMKAVLEALKPDGAIWRPAPGGDFDRLLEGLGDAAQEIYEYSEALSHLRDPRRTTVLTDLEKEYGLLTNQQLSEQERRDQLAALKYDIPDTASDDLLEDKLRKFGFDGIIVTENNPQINPDLITGELLVNGPVYISQEIGYLAQANGDNTFAGNGIAVAGYYIKNNRETYEYEFPPTAASRWQYWRFAFFVGGAASGWPGSPAIAIHDVDYKKEQFLKRLILAYKPMRTWAILVANYIMIWTAAEAAGTFAQSFRAGIYGDGLYTVAGDSGEIQVSTDRVNWEEQTADSFSSRFSAGASGAGIRLLVGSNGEIQISTDGENWTAQTADGGYTGDFRAATYGDELFIIAGENGEIQTSSDGVTWTAQAAAGGYTGSFWAATYGDDIYLLAGDTGEIQTSSDGVTWTAQTADGGYTDRFYGAAHGDATFTIVGQNGEIQTSPAGVTWTAQAAAGAYSDDFRSADYGNKRFVISGETGEIESSVDLGVTWIKETPDGSFSDPFYSMNYGAGFFIAAGESAEIQWS